MKKGLESEKNLIRWLYFIMVLIIYFFIAVTFGKDFYLLALGLFSAWTLVLIIVPRR